MATGTSGVTDLNSLFENIYQDALFTVTDNLVAQRIVRNYVNGRGLQTRNLATYPTLSASTLSEETDMTTATVFGKTSITTLTPGEIGMQVIITDSMIETAQENIRGDAALALAQGVAEKIDTDILAGGTEFTGGSLGANGTSMTWGYAMAAEARLIAAGVPRPHYLVLHPYQWNDLAVAVAPAATVTNAPSVQDMVAAQYIVGRAVGFDAIFVSQNVPTSSTDAFGLAFNPMALVFDLRRPMRLEPQRDASLRAWELNMSCVYGAGVWRPAFGLYIKTDITAPTS
jgi:hypothetical protein